MDPVRSLLTGIVDYAGLFPPTSATMADAVDEFERQRLSAHSWMLSAFVVGAARLPELAATSAGTAGAWRLSVLVGGEFEAGLRELATFLAEQAGRFGLGSLEWKPDRPVDIPQFLNRAPEVEVFIELPWDEDLEEWLAPLRGTGARAKIRCGGVTPELIPPAEQVARFLLACHRAGVGTKFTAGLHHPVRSVHPLTYEPDAPRALMHGFLNVFTAAALVAQGELSESVLIEVLEETDPAAFRWTARALAWRDHEIGGADLDRARSQIARSFGSCSFAEPLEDLHTLGVL